MGVHESAQDVGTSEKQPAPAPPNPAGEGQITAEVTTEVEKFKSAVGLDPNPPTTPAAYDEGDNVTKAILDTNNRWVQQRFVISGTLFDSSSRKWTYRLRIPGEDWDYEGGQWFVEDDLEWS